MKRTLPVSLFSIYYFGLLVLVVGMPLSVFLMSVSQFIMLGAWLLSDGLVNKLRIFFSNRTALIVSSVFLLHLVGLLYTTDMDFGMRDTKIKIPLLLLPLVISTMPKLNPVQFRWLLYTFCAAVVTGTLISTALLLGFGKKEVTDTRQISLFVSHIRFSLMICLSVFILCYYALTDRSWKKNVIYFFFISWLVVFLIMLESLTGLFTLAVAGTVFLGWYVFRCKKWFFKLAFLGALAAGTYTLYTYIKNEIADFYTIKDTSDLLHLDSLTAHGNPYIHYTANANLQNGYFIGIYVCWEEMDQAWAARSRIKPGELDKKGNMIMFTLQRYLTSKGLRKDREGVNALTEEDVKNIESGYPDVRYPHLPPLKVRMQGILWELNEYKQGKDPSGHSVTQRFEFWRAACGIIKKNPGFGVGTGDPDLAFKEEYRSNGTLLKEAYRFRSHNQFLAMGVAFGLIGLTWFFISFFYPLTLPAFRKDFLFLSFLLIAFISMLNEDTLETQAGVTFFAFFNALFLFGRKDPSAS
jgi:hypothetical protein